MPPNTGPLRGAGFRIPWREPLCPLWTEGGGFIYLFLFS